MAICKFVTDETTRVAEVNQPFVSYLHHQFRASATNETERAFKRFLDIDFNLHSDGFFPFLVDIGKIRFNELPNFISDDSGAVHICVAHWNTKSMNPDSYFVEINFSKSFIRGPSRNGKLVITKGPA
ncbi:hypothetical protein CASFOL_000636 [Castilleja foliolosa]|uniref:Uncharacterized protein n=1 Tax=Castilleja foliolosa TaxID=1961234 RepID=A0ABD3EP12_9LAMI